LIGVPRDKVIGRRLSDIEPKARIIEVLELGQPVYHDYFYIESVGINVVANIFPFYDEGKVDFSLLQEIEKRRRWLGASLYHWEGKTWEVGGFLIKHLSRGFLGEALHDCSGSDGMEYRERALSSVFREGALICVSHCTVAIIPQKNAIEFHSEKTSGQAVGLRGS
jgi:hypothetical protein